MRRRPIDRNRLKAACLASTKSENTLAKDAGLAHSTLSRALSGKIRTLNPKTLSKLSGILRVPEKWLTGERRDLPYVPEFGTPPPAAGSAARAPVTLWEHPTVGHVRHSWFMQRVDDAVRRDLRELFGENHDTAYRSWGQTFLSIMSLMTSSMVWRVQAHAIAGRGGWHGVVSGADDMMAVNWLEHVLDPWLTGEDYLGAGLVLAMYQALTTNATWHDPIRDEDAVRVLAKYAQHVEAAHAARLAEEHNWAEDDDGTWVGPEGLLLEKSTKKPKRRRAQKAGKRRARKR